MIASRPLHAVCLVMLIGMMGLPASAATVTFTVGNVPQIDENVLLDLGMTGTTVFGLTNNTQLQVQFDSTTDTLTEPSAGQARIEPVDGALNDITVSVPGGTFTSLIFNAFDGSGAATITVATTGDVFSYTLGNGQNFATIVSDVPLVSVRIAAPDGFADLRQVRIGGAALVVPLPSSAFAGIGLMVAIAGLRVVRQRRQD